MDDFGWYERKNLEGHIDNSNDLTFDTFAPPDHPPLLLSELIQLKNQTAGLWLAMGTVELPDALTAKLEARWGKAMARIGVKPQRNVKDPNEVPARRYIEGATKRIVVNAYERNDSARRTCIDHYGPTCSVCDFNFVATYGNAGIGFTHVHHLKQLSKIGKQYSLDPIKDLCPVCPNCHAMMHTRSPSYSIKELKAMLIT